PRWAATPTGRVPVADPFSAYLRFPQQTNRSQSRHLSWTCDDPSLKVRGIRSMLVEPQRHLSRCFFPRFFLRFEVLALGARTNSPVRRACRPRSRDLRFAHSSRGIVLFRARKDRSRFLSGDRWSGLRVEKPAWGRMILGSSDPLTTVRCRIGRFRVKINLPNS